MGLVRDALQIVWLLLLLLLVAFSIHKAFGSPQLKKAHCTYCFDGPCFSRASCNNSCTCMKGPYDQTGMCVSLGYKAGYVARGYRELP